MVDCNDKRAVSISTGAPSRGGRHSTRKTRRMLATSRRRRPHCHVEMNHSASVTCDVGPDVRRLHDELPIYTPVDGAGRSPSSADRDRCRSEAAATRLFPLQSHRHWPLVRPVADSITTRVSINLSLYEPRRCALLRILFVVYVALWPSQS